MTLAHSPQRNLPESCGFYGTVASVARHMTELRGRRLALLIGLLLTGLLLAPTAHASRKAPAHTVHRAADSLAGRGMWIWNVSR